MEIESRPITKLGCSLQHERTVSDLVRNEHHYPSLDPASLESSAKLEENRITREIDEKSSASEATSIGHHRDKSNHVRPKEKINNFYTGAEDGTSSKSEV
ncbi:hypothetical protein V6N13_080034 [Hibiscus sabdariffa]